MTSKHTGETIETPAEMIHVRYVARGQHGMIEASEPVYLHAESSDEKGQPVGCLSLARHN